MGSAPILGNKSIARPFLCEGRPSLSLAHPRLYRPILDYTRDGQGAFLADSKTQDAVIRNLEIIGEAVKNISGDLKSVYPDIPWQRIAGMRDRMIHEYFGVNLQIVWERVEQDVPELSKR